jgi:hypothetical protein
MHGAGSAAEMKAFIVVRMGRKPAATRTGKRKCRLDNNLRRAADRQTDPR